MSLPRRRPRAFYRELKKRQRKERPNREDIPYGGYRMASKLEWAWAVFFDTAGIEWVYEPPGVSLPSGALYPPDFYLPDYGVYIECKGKVLERDVVAKIQGAVRTTRTPFMLLRGSPQRLAMQDDPSCWVDVYRPMKGRVERNRGFQLYLDVVSGELVFMSDTMALTPSVGMVSADALVPVINTRVYREFLRRHNRGPFPKE